MPGTREVQVDAGIDCKENAAFPNGKAAAFMLLGSNQ